MRATNFLVNIDYLERYNIIEIHLYFTDSTQFTTPLLRIVR